ncbi:hypothetical protein FLA_6058 [Filimonas lacunae]|nr:hypothetical protein FLA_6058 [Filimonas lacunae]
MSVEEELLLQAVVSVRVFTNTSNSGCKSRLAGLMDMMGSTFITIKWTQK